LAKIIKKTIDLKSFFEFSEGSEPLCLDDILNYEEDQDASYSNFLSSPGFFVYSLDFFVDTQHLLDLGIDKLTFKIFATNPTEASIPIDEGTFDIHIETNEDPLISLGNTGINYSPSMSKKVLLSSDLFGPTNTQNIKSVALVSSQTPRQEGLTFKKISKDLLEINGSDIAEVLSSGDYFETTPNMSTNFGISNVYREFPSNNFLEVKTGIFQGLVSLREIKKNLVPRDQRSQLTPASNSLIREKKPIDSYSFSKTSNAIMANVMFQKKEYNRKIFINKDSLQGAASFYLAVMAQTPVTSKLWVKPAVFFIDHKSETSDFLTCPEAPTIKVLSSSESQIAFSVTKTDPSLSQVRILRIVSNPRGLYSSPEVLKDLNFRSPNETENYQKNTLVFTDQVNNIYPNVVTYRFITVNSDGSYGKFSSYVSKPDAKVTFQRKSESPPVSIRAINTFDGIQILVDVVTDQIKTLRLLRQDLGQAGESSETTKNISTPSGDYFFFVNNSKRTLSFLDQDTVAGRNYRYFVAYRIGSELDAAASQETLSIEDEVIKRELSFDTNFVYDLTNVSQTFDESGRANVSFNLDVTQDKDSVLILMQSLRKFGIEGNFINEILNDSQKLKEVVAFLVERVDRTTGRKASFGIYPPGIFEDNYETRRKKSLPELKSGKMYEYICKMKIRPPNTFRASSNVEFFDNNLKIPTAVQSLKYQMPGTLSGKILSNNVQLNGLSIDENFEIGSTGIELTAEVSIARSGPQFKSFSIKERKNFNLISWELTGDVSYTSYFLVWCNYNGRNNLLGTVSTSGEQGTYKFKDDRFFGEVGRKSYTIQAVSTTDDLILETSPANSYLESSTSISAINNCAITAEDKDEKTIVFSVKNSDKIKISRLNDSSLPQFQNTGNTPGTQLYRGKNGEMTWNSDTSNMNNSTLEGSKNESSIEVLRKLYSK